MLIHCTWPMLHCWFKLWSHPKHEAAENSAINQVSETAACDNSHEHTRTSKRNYYFIPCRVTRGLIWQVPKQYARFKMIDVRLCRCRFPQAVAPGSSSKQVSMLAYILVNIGSMAIQKEKSDASQISCLPSLLKISTSPRGLKTTRFGTSHCGFLRGPCRCLSPRESSQMQYILSNFLFFTFFFHYTLLIAACMNFKNYPSKPIAVVRSGSTLRNPFLQQTYLPARSCL